MPPGYHAVGPYVTLAAITPTEVVDLVSFNLAQQPDRLTCLVRIIKLCRLIKPLQEVIGYRTDPEFVEIMRHFQPFSNAKWILLILLFTGIMAQL